MAIKLYVIPGSHPCDCVEAAMRLKGLEYERVDLLPLVHKAVIGARFRAGTVPAMTIDGERIVGSRPILRRLDRLAPEPPLLPSDPALRARVEEAESFGDETLQPIARRIAWAALKRNRAAMMSYARDSRLGLPQPLVKLGSAPVAAAACRYNRATDAQVREDLRSLPGHLDRVDGWIAEGVLGGESPNAADLQIGSSIRLLRTFADVAPLLSGRPCEGLGERGFRPLPGSVPAGTLPADFIPAQA
ncbi:MAG TPA: glutathione S-transferase N-terminal domain-containing protein [Thermoleophilaceae bacterium]|nr:glutathione S-transferase N-terminal domain-containing protein [Thermoleophilaceae bacterium]